MHTRSYLLTMRILSSLDVWFIVSMMEIEGEASDEIYLEREREERERENQHSYLLTLESHCLSTVAVL